MGFDGDTTGLAVQALIAMGATGDDPAVVAALRLAAQQQAPRRRVARLRHRVESEHQTIVVLGIEAAGFDVTTSCWRDTVAPELAGTPYTDPVAWTRSQQQSDGHIASPYDSVG